MALRTLIDAFRRQCETRPAAVAVIDECSSGELRSLRWDQLATAVAYTATAIADHFQANPRMERRIGHSSDNSLADLLVALASMSLATVEVPLDHRLAAAEVRCRWDRVGGLWLDEPTRAQLTRNALAAARDGNLQLDLRPLDPDAPSLILWTTGTTKTPQGVVLSQRNLFGNAAAKLAAVPQSAEDVRLSVLPLAHAYARTCDFGTWLLSGGTLVATVGMAGLQRLAPQVRPTLINTVPSLATRLLGEDTAELGLGRLRLLGCGGAAISTAAFAQWQQRGVTIIQGYGLTEAGPVVCSATPQDATAGLVGRFVNGWEHQLRDGELFIRGPHVMLGYWQAAEATRMKIDPDGWMSTGDLVELDQATGQCRILGRSDDVIVLDNGYKISPSLIEREVEQIPAVRHAMIKMGNGLQLWLDTDCDPTTLVATVDQLLARHPHCGACTIHRFQPPLSEAAGELTSKRTIRRRKIIDNRF